MSTLLRRQVADADAKILAKEQELDRMLRKQPDDLRKVADWVDDISALKQDIAALTLDVEAARRWLAMSV